MASLLEPDRVLVSVNGSDSDEQAIKLACNLASKKKGTVFILNVLEVARNLPIDSPAPNDIERSDNILERMEHLAKTEKCEVELEAVQAREAGPAVVNEAIERNVDIIVMGLDYKKKHGEFNLGSTINYVLRRAPCRVWVSREPAAAGTISENGHEALH